MHFPFIRYRKIFYLFSLVLIIGSIISIFVFGLNLGIEFTGGAILKITYKKAPSFEEIKRTLKDLDLGKISFQKEEKERIVLKMNPLNETLHQEVLNRLKKLGEIEEESEDFQLIGPVIGKELKQKTKIVIILAILAILLYIALSFRKISRPVPSYVYALASIIAICHDVLISLGILVILGHLQEVEITIPIITAFLTIIGYSINNTVIVFDRIRENLIKAKSPIFELIIEKSLNQTLTRSLNTSLTVLFVLFAIFFFGGVTLKYFALTLILGISFGTYSSLCLAAPLIFNFYSWKK